MASDLAAAIGKSISNSWSWWWEGKNPGDEIPGGALLVLVVIITVFWYLWIIRKSRKEVLPPGPRGLPIVGNLPFIDPEMHTYFSKLADVYGPIFKLRLGKKLCVVIGLAELAKEVMKDQDATFANRDVPVSVKVMKYYGSDMVFVPYGPHWRTVRLICVREMLSKTSLDSLYTLRRNEIHRAVKNIYSKKETPINIVEQMFSTMLNVITTMLWSGRHGDEGKDNENSATISSGSEFRLMATEIVELLGKPNISDFFPVLARFDIQGIERRMKKVVSSVDQFFDSIIERRMRMNQVDKHNDVLQTLLQIKDQEKSKTPFTLTTVKALFMNLVVGGTDTSSVTVEWAMAELMKNPEIMRKAQEELDVVVGRNNLVDESHLPKLKYVGAVLKETMRLHPGVPLLVSRCPSSSCKVGDYTIPKGAQVWVNAYAIQRNPIHWDNPMEFQPERFFSDSTRKYEYNGTDFRYIPFGSGRRTCVGIPLVERMVPYVLATLLHSFEWRLPEGTKAIDLEEKFGIVLKKATPLIAVPSPRLSDPNLYS